MWLAGKDFETSRFSVRRGMPIPAKYSARWVLAQLRKDYGEDAVVWGDYFGGDDGEITKLKAENRVLTERIEGLERIISRRTSKGRQDLAGKEDSNEEAQS